jgi:CPA2 family monovalent cation:H+ antiporter-2
MMSEPRAPALIAMHVDAALGILVAIVFAIVLVAIALRAIGQPQIVGYLLAGVAIGPSGLGLLTDTDAISRVGSFGLIILLFFVGMDASPKRLMGRWHVAVAGVALQIAASVGVAFLVGVFYGWDWPRIALVAFVISLSSTAVVLKLLEDWRELDTQTGQNVLVILLAQDLALVPMLIGVTLMSGQGGDAATLTLQLAGAVLLVGLTAWVVRRERIHLPFAKYLRADHELQVFAALLLCFGLALASGVLRLSAMLGAFVAGIVVSAARETDWVHRSLEPFRVVFVAVFFVSVGMLIDLAFVAENLLEIAPLVAAIVGVNTAINAAILKVLGSSMRRSLYGGALLSQIGEFSFVLVSVGVAAGVIAEPDYRFMISVIAISLLLSPPWITFWRYALDHPEGHPDRPAIDRGSRR